MDKTSTWTSRGRPDAPRKRVIGITIFPAKTGFSFWSNGAHANCAFLWLCLHAAGYDVRMLNGGDGVPPAPEAMPPELREMVFHPISDETLDQLDVLIQAGAQISAAQAERVHARGGKVVTYKFGADFPIDAERAVHGLPSGAIFNGTRFDEVWTTDQHVETCGGYWEICYRAPVRVLPHIWHPCFVDEVLSAMPNAPRGYDPKRSAKKRIVIFEPNIQLIKTAHIPMLIADAAFRRSPELFEHVLVTNAERLKPFEAFTTFVNNLDLTKSKAADGLPLISFEARFNTPYFMSTHGDIVISHQWIPAANYNHYDLLYMGYPLVHNVPEMRYDDVGFYYHKFDAVEGSKRLLDLMTSTSYDPAPGRAFVRGRMATAPSNVEAHAKMLERITS